MPPYLAKKQGMAVIFLRFFSGLIEWAYVAVGIMVGINGSFSGN